MSGVDSIINYEKSEKEDYYGILGCDESASEEQINTEYKVRALQYHPDKNPDDKEAEAKFQLLTEAKETLLDPGKRKNYDKWKNSGISISYKSWTSMKDHVHQSMHWATFKTKDRMLGEGGSEASGTSPSGPRSSSVSAAARRASEGGANIHWGAKGTMKWDKDASSDVVNKFRNYEI